LAAVVVLEVGQVYQVVLVVELVKHLAAVV
jgi:hypothetical protein